MSDDIIQGEKNPGSIEEKLERTRKELAILYDISNAMRTTLELNHILYIILTGVTAHTGLGFNRAVLFLVNKRERVLEGKMVIGPESGEEAEKIWKYIEHENADMEDLISAYKNSENTPTPLSEQIKRLKIPLHSNDSSLLAMTYHKGNSLHIRKDSISQYVHDPFLQVFKTNELVIMPLKAKDKVNGIIIADNFYTQKPIVENDLKIFTMLANQAGLAIENSQLYEMIVHKSNTDSLTALWNHGFFQDTLLLEIDKAREDHVPTSLLIIDIDNFKKFNDTWGHQSGDIVLAKLAKLLKDCAREMDFVCRYGGEEFSIILTQTGKEQAFVIAERMREKVAQYKFEIAPSEQPLNLTVSIGIASYPEHAQTKEDLISKADKAMYTAKFIGKNKTIMADSQGN